MTSTDGDGRGKGRDLARIFHGSWVRARNDTALGVLSASGPTAPTVSVTVMHSQSWLRARTMWAMLSRLRSPRAHSWIAHTGRYWMPTSVPKTTSLPATLVGEHDLGDDTALQISVFPGPSPTLCVFEASKQDFVRNRCFLD